MEVEQIAQKNGVMVEGTFYSFGKTLQFSNDGKNWKEREFSGYIAKDDKPFKSAGTISSSWSMCQEVPPPVQMTVEEIEAKFGVKVALPTGEETQHKQAGVAKVSREEIPDTKA